MTREFVLLGHPVGHSVSPAIHAAAYEALGIDGRYRTVDCPDRASVETQFALLRAGALLGANVTVPHKQLALELADHVDPLANEAGAANVLVPTAEGIKAYNTDVLALVEELGDVKPSTGAVILGSGGAARAAIVACKQLGVAPIHVTARRLDGQPGDLAAQLSALGASPLPWPKEGGHELREVLQGSGLVIQTTSAGMLGAAPGDAVSSRIDWARLGQGSIAYDVIYNPTWTPFLERARDHGLDARGGLGMLVGQAAHALRLWLGEAPPRPALVAAARRAMGLDL